MINESEIIQAIARGGKQQFAKLYDHFSDRVYNTALSYSKNAEDAEEITQDVFVKIFKNAASFQGNAALSTWIYRITVNTSLNYLKRKNRFSLFKNNFADAQTIDFEHPGVVLEKKENAVALYAAMDCLPDSQKTAFILSYIEDLPRQEVADIMQASLKSVESLLQRAKKNMRSALEKSYPNRRKSKNQWSK